MKAKSIVKFIAMFVIAISVIGSVGSYVDTLDYEVGNKEPKIVSVEGEFVEVEDLPSGIKWDEYYSEDYKPVRLDYVLYNPANTLLYLTGSIAEYDAETEYGYCSTLSQSNDGMLIDYYYYCDVLPADCTGTHTEYIRVPIEANHVVVTTYADDDRDEVIEQVVFLE